MNQGMFDMPTVERLSSWNGHERWQCGQWIVLHGITTLDIRHDGAEIVRLQCDTIEQSVKARQALFTHLVTCHWPWMLYAALGFTDVHGIAADFQTPAQRMAKWVAWARSL